MQLGFVIDQSRCIGCHACTVACKSENQVPVGDFRTWVKYTEQGEFPAVRRSFSVLRCNQCTNAPCVTICPVTALDKAANGIVDIDPALCIGCKSCMHACPYDALYLNAETGTAQKCHFCAHRVELGLAPACAVVCPTEAIIPGDFHDPESRVATMARDLSLTKRKPEAGTGPNVLYKDVATANIDPGLANKSGGFLWSNPQGGAQMDAQVFEAANRELCGEEAQARTTYDVPRKELWGWKVTGYLFFKALASGILPVAILARWLSGNGLPGTLEAGLSLFFLGLTLLLLVLDLKRPERFLSILLRPNWDSWLAKGSFLILGYSALLMLWIADSLLGFGLRQSSFLGTALGALVVLSGGLTACYTAWLFAQAKGRVLWMRRHLWAHFIVQAALAGSAFIALLCCGLGWDALDGARPMLTNIMLFSLIAHLVFTLLEERMAPLGREAEYERASRLVTRGPWMKFHWLGSVLIGTLVPILLLLIAPHSFGLQLAGVLVLGGLWIAEDVFLRAGQALPIS